MGACCLIWRARGTLVPGTPSRGSERRPRVLGAPTVHYDALMDENATALASAIGARVRTERHARGWTLDQLANAAAVSRRLVVNVEQGAANPSVGTLLRLSH